MDMTAGSCSGSEESYAGTHFIWSEISRLVLQTVAFCHCLLELFKCRALAIAGGWVLDLLSELTWLQWCFAALQRSSYKNSRVRAVKYFRSEIEWIPFLFFSFFWETGYWDRPVVGKVATRWSSFLKRKGAAVWRALWLFVAIWRHLCEQELLCRCIN